MKVYTLSNLDILFSILWLPIFVLFILLFLIINKLESYYIKNASFMFSQNNYFLKVLGFLSFKEQIYKNSQLLNCINGNSTSTRMHHIKKISDKTNEIYSVKNVLTLMNNRNEGNNKKFENGKLFSNGQVKYGKMFFDEEIFKLSRNYIHKLKESTNSSIIPYSAPRPPFNPKNDACFSSDNLTHFTKVELIQMQSFREFIVAEVENAGRQRGKNIDIDLKMIANVSFHKQKNLISHFNMLPIDSIVKRNTCTSSTKMPFCRSKKNVIIDDKVNNEFISQNNSTIHFKEMQIFNFYAQRENKIRSITSTDSFSQSQYKINTKDQNMKYAKIEIPFLFQGKNLQPIFRFSNQSRISITYIRISKCKPDKKLSEIKKIVKKRDLSLDISFPLDYLLLLFCMSLGFQFNHRKFPYTNVMYESKQ